MYRSTDKDELAKTYCPYRSYSRVLEYWKAMGWIEHFPGYRNYDDFEGTRVFQFGKAGRLRATPTFLALADDMGIEPTNAQRHFPKDHLKSRPVQVKSRKGSDYRNRKNMTIKPPHSPKLEVLNSEVASLNAFLETFEFNISTPQYKRTFNNGDDPHFNYDQGGRLYCVSDDNYQQWDGSERVKITINGEPCSEVDVSSSFLLVFHWLCGATFDVSKDLYRVPGIERMVVKKLIVCRFGADDWPTQWPKGFKADYEKETGKKLLSRYKLSETCEAIQNALPILASIEQTKNGWAQLQYWESQAVIAAMRELREAGIAALPIHDSLLVPASHVDAAKQALERSYLDHFEIRPGLKAHPPLDQIQ
jgi:hypothetical protein